MKFRIVPNGEIHGASMEEKRRLKREWVSYFRYPCIRPMTVTMFLFFIGACMAVMADMLHQFPAFLAPILMITAYTMIKLDEYGGYIVFFVSVGVMLFYTSRAANDLAAIAGTVALLSAAYPAFRIILLMKNYKIIQALKEEPGYPSFFENAADMYGDKIYLREWETPEEDSPDESGEEAKPRRDYFQPFAEDGEEGEPGETDAEEEDNSYLYANLPEKDLPPVPRNAAEVEALLKAQKQDTEVYFDPYADAAEGESGYAPHEIYDTKGAESDERDTVGNEGMDLPQEKRHTELPRVHGASEPGRKRRMRMVRWHEGGEGRREDIHERPEKRDVDPADSGTGEG